MLVPCSLSERIVMPSAIPAYIPRAARLIAARLGLRAPVHVQTLTPVHAYRIARGIGMDDVNGAYAGMWQGAHVIYLRAEKGGRPRHSLGLLRSLAHELAHAAQAERLGGEDAFFRAYRAHREYRENPFEAEANQFADAFIARYAAEAERIEDAS